MKIFKILSVAILIVFGMGVVACDNKENVVAENISLSNAMIGEVEFQNSEDLKLDQDDGEWVVDGGIEAMTDAQKAAFGSSDVTHVVVLKLLFDKERTIDYLKIEGSVTKVYSTNKEDGGYIGSISSILDNDDGEDAFTYLILSANTKKYDLTIKYTDGVISNLKIEIKAMLVSANDK